MIRVVKPKSIPNILKTNGELENQLNEQRYEDGIRDFKFKTSIYGNDSVKRVLKVAQHNKCCFCEKGQKDEWGAVEHFRPKGGFHSTRGTNVTTPGYYWLAYRWSNLYFVCGTCNTNFKGNLFPLINEAERARSHQDDLKNEKPLLLDPSGLKDPENHISFDREYPEPKGGSKFGDRTIEVCGLDRPALNEERKEKLNEIDDRIMILLDPESSEPLKRKAKQYIRESMRPTAKFSSAAACYIRSFSNITL